MEAMNFEIFFIFMVILGFASSLLQYRAYVKIKAHESIRKDIYGSN